MNPLIEQIQTAFSGVAFPGEESLTDSFGDEAEALVRTFREHRDWQALTADFLNQAPEGWASALSFLSAPALHFYLPAYLIADINGDLETCDPSFRLCAFVTPQMAPKKIARFYGGGTLGDHARLEFKVFNRAQVSAIVAYLWWKLAREDYNPMIEQAMEHYWLVREAEYQEP